ncbi:MAG: hypothetical protein CMN32_17340 [Saprospirales bacterium]|nr:hypothetical protein [Saprospirales bacterium]
MKEKLKTSIQFTKNLFTTGAFKQTSRKVELEICSLLPKTGAQTIVEFGIGHGNITREILRTISPESRLIAFEVNPEFCEYVSEHIEDERLTIVNDGAENLRNYVEGSVHGVVSSLPLTLFPKELRKSILQTAYDALEPGAYYNQILYTRVHQKMLTSIFDECSVVRFINIPLEYVYHCRKLSKKS